MIIVSACLAGVKCRYDGKSSDSEEIIHLVRDGKAIPVCPEQLGGLPTPREPCELREGRAVTEDGKDFTACFNSGAEEGWKIAKLARCRRAILKGKSPSCGLGSIYDGNFSGELTEGDGIFAELLKKKGIKVQNI